jgi:hypothetical protein
LTIFFRCVINTPIDKWQNQLKKIHLSNFRKKFDDKTYQAVKDAISKNSFMANEVNINKILDIITDPDVKTKFKSWSNGYDFAVLN